MRQYYIHHSGRSTISRNCLDWLEDTEPRTGVPDQRRRNQRIWHSITINTNFYLYLFAPLQIYFHTVNNLESAPDTMCINANTFSMLHNKLLPQAYLLPHSKY